jgi:hypothetical protein
MLMEACESTRSKPAKEVCASIPTLFFFFLDDFWPIFEAANKNQQESMILMVAWQSYQDKELVN